MMQQKIDATGRRVRRQSRPTAIFWVQFILRSVGFIASLIAIAIASFVAVKIRKTWGFVFVSTVLTLLVDLAEITALISRRSLTLWFPRIQVFVLIGLDALAIGLLVWSFFSLIFDKWGKRQAVSTVGYTADPFNGIEMWLAVTIG